MKVGAEPRKVAILAVLTVAAGYLVYSNLISGPDGMATPARPAASAPEAPRSPIEVGRPVPRSDPPEAVPRSAVQEFRPSLKPRKEGERLDLSQIDPTLRLDLLAKLQDVTFEGGDRSLFEFSAAPLPKKPEPKIIPKTPAELAKEEDTKPPESVKPPPPPIPLRFYGYVTQARQGAKRAFFLEGEEIFVASEGDVVKKRYKIVRIGVNSAVVEDIQHKHEQTLPLVAEAG